ncbi:hypothetical protein [Limosilactobacillus mucosae]|uniref:hypothetical protein n=1 Tax=Limosilactobacillus mucosae TaxID=97478 RepID=UPI0015D669DC|nr:hypothetical protein [Limosilactobacillus mucosae]
MQPNYLRNFHKRISKDDLKVAKSSGKQGGVVQGKFAVVGWEPIAAVSTDFYTTK